MNEKGGLQPSPPSGGQDTGSQVKEMSNAGLELDTVLIPAWINIKMHDIIMNIEPYEQINRDQP